jgi:GNAT superfamily N-acetyltransferase
MNIEIVNYDEKYKDSILYLIRSHLNIAFTEKRFDWLHFQNLMAPSKMQIVLDGSEVIGFRAVIKKSVCIHGETHIIGREIDPVVNKKYRGKGIFSAIIEHSLKKFNDIDIFLNFSNKLAAPGYIKKGWHALPIHTYYYLSSSNEILSKQFLISIFSQVKLAKMKQIFKIHPISLTELKFKNNYQNEYPINIVKDEQYIKWRYANPDRIYQFFQVSFNNNVISYLICRIENGRCLLLDIIKTRKDISSGRIMRDFLCFIHKQYNNMLVSAWEQTSQDVNRYMLKKISAKPTVVYIRESPNKKFNINIYDSKNWYMPMGESEFL